MVEIKWQDPPSRSGNASRAWDPVVEQLKAHPGKWALVATDWTYSAPPAAFRQHGCEATARRNKEAAGEKKTWSVYARCPIKASPVNAEKLHVQKAVAQGTALTPPAPAPPRRQATTPPANDFGISKFVADRRARGVPDGAE